LSENYHSWLSGCTRIEFIKGKQGHKTRFMNYFKVTWGWKNKNIANDRE